MKAIIALVIVIGGPFLIGILLCVLAFMGYVFGVIGS